MDLLKLTLAVLLANYIYFIAWWLGSPRWKLKRSRWQYAIPVYGVILLFKDIKEFFI